MTEIQIELPNKDIVNIPPNVVKYFQMIDVNDFMGGSGVVVWPIPEWTTLNDPSTTMAEEGLTIDITKPIVQNIVDYLIMYEDNKENIFAHTQNELMAIKHDSGMILIPDENPYAIRVDNRNDLQKGFFDKLSDDEIFQMLTVANYLSVVVIFDVIAFSISLRFENHQSETIRKNWHLHYFDLSYLDDISEEDTNNPLLNVKHMRNWALQGITGN